CRYRQHVESQWRFGDRDGVGVERGLAPMDALHEAAGPRRPLMLARSLVGAPTRDLPVLGGAEIVVEPGAFGLLAGELLLPALAFGPAACEVTVDTAAVDARRAIRGGV